MSARRDAAARRAAAPASPAAAPSPARRTEPAYAGLQRAAGNRAFGALVQRRRAAGDDPLEREAARAGDDILRPSPGTTPVPRPVGGGGAGTRASAGGAPLPAAERVFFAERWGRDFGAVRIHTDARASAGARALGALAYARGQDVVFRAGAWAPGTPAGRRLLAHELAHVAQQAEGRTAVRVQRYESPEHQDLGDRYLNDLLAFLQTEAGRAWAAGIGENRDTLVAQIRADPMRSGATIRMEPRASAAPGAAPGTPGAAPGAAPRAGAPLELTPGEVISLMGDFYGSVAELASAPPAEIRQILATIGRQRAGTIGSTAADAEYERITGGRFLRLAAQNAPHFAPRNRAEWRRLHLEAVAEARAAGTAGAPVVAGSAGPAAAEAQFQRALLKDAAAGHFLTDAYAAGHLFDQGQVLAAITLHLNARPLQTANPQLQAYVQVIAAAGRLPHLVLKNIHDRLNLEGFEVSNARGMRWRTRGDDHLREATETQRVAALAVFRSRQQIYAARQGQTPNPAEVEGLMPDDASVTRATQLAISYIPQAVREVESLIYRNRGLAPTQFGTVAGSIIRSNLDAIGDPGRERSINEAVQAAERRRSGPVVAPIFTLGRF